MSLNNESRATEERRCDKCMFWHRVEEDVPIGECKIHNPIPHTTTVVADDGEETLVIQALWPAPEADEFCWEFMAKREEPNEKLFNLDSFISWMDQNLSGNFIVDLQVGENGLGISGKIIDQTMEHCTKSLMNLAALEGRTTDITIRIYEYLHKFFPPEDVDVSIT